MNKKELRIKLKQERRSLSKEEVSKLSNIIIDKTINIINKYPVDTFFIYNSFNNEVDTRSLINYLLKNNKKVYMPKIVNQDMVAIKYDETSTLENGKYNILEPDGETSSIDKFICITPLVGVDIQGNRIGFGKGYYDKFLNSKTCLKIGLCYDFQIINELIDTYPHDIPMDIIISEKRTIQI